MSILYRFIVTPTIPTFLKSPLNWIDFVATLSFYSDMLLQHFFKVCISYLKLPTYLPNFSQIIDFDLNKNIRKLLVNLFLVLCFCYFKNILSYFLELETDVLSRVIYSNMPFRGIIFQYRLLLISPLNVFHITGGIPKAFIKTFI